MNQYKEMFDEARQVSSDWSSGYRELQRNSDNQAIEFGKLIVQSLLLLHGGALVAIPSFKLAFDLGSKLGTYTFWLMFFIFVIGLILTIVAAALAFHSLANRADGNMKMIGVADSNAWAQVYRLRLSLESNERFEELAKEAETNSATEEALADGFFEKFVQQRKWVICLLWASIACLVTGSLVGMMLAAV